MACDLTGLVHRCREQNGGYVGHVDRCRHQGLHGAQRCRARRDGRPVRRAHAGVRGRHTVEAGRGVGAGHTGRDEGDELRGYAFCTLERIGGTPCVLIGLASVARTRAARRRRSRHHPRPDAPGRAGLPRRGRARRRPGSATPPGSRPSPRCRASSRGPSIRRTARSVPGAAAWPSATASRPPPTTSGRSWPGATAAGRPRCFDHEQPRPSRGRRRARRRCSPRSTPTRATAWSPSAGPWRKTCGRSTEPCARLRHAAPPAVPASDRPATPSPHDPVRTPSDGAERRHPPAAHGPGLRARPVPPAEVDRLLDLARRAPSAGNTPGLRVRGARGRGDRPPVGRDAAARAPVRRSAGRGCSTAPVVVVPLVRPDAYARRYAEADKADTGLGTGLDAWPVPYWWVDGGMVVEALLLAADRRRPRRAVLRPVRPRGGRPRRPRRAEGLAGAGRRGARPPGRRRRRAGRVRLAAASPAPGRGRPPRRVVTCRRRAVGCRWSDGPPRPTNVPANVPRPPGACPRPGPGDGRDRGPGGVYGVPKLLGDDTPEATDDAQAFLDAWSEGDLGGHGRGHQGPAVARSPTTTRRSTEGLQVESAPGSSWATSAGPTTCRSPTSPPTSSSPAWASGPTRSSMRLEHDAGAAEGEPEWLVKWSPAVFNRDLAGLKDGRAPDPPPASGPSGRHQRVRRQAAGPVGARRGSWASSPRPSRTSTP